MTQAEVYARAVRRIVKAAKKGVGVRLTADECIAMSLDMGDWACVTDTPAKEG